jgi:hypothetical protein
MAIVAASKANEAGPNFKRTQLTFLSTAAGCQLKGGFNAPACHLDGSDALGCNEITQT